MLLAHLPAGYILTKSIQKITGNHSYIWLGIFASIVPDLDMFYFYLIDDKQTNHHDYFTHLPIFWVATLAVSFAVTSLFARTKAAYFMLFIFYANIFVHMLLDSYAGYIKWLHPFSQIKMNLVDVPASYDWWVWSFVLHWSFLAEVCIIIIAILAFCKSRSHSKKQS